MVFRKITKNELRVGLRVWIQTENHSVYDLVESGTLDDIGDVRRLEREIDGGINLWWVLDAT